MRLSTHGKVANAQAVLFETFESRQDFKDACIHRRILFTSLLENWRRH